MVYTTVHGGLFCGSWCLTLWFMVVDAVVCGVLPCGLGALLCGLWSFTLWFMVVYAVVCGVLLCGL